MIVEKDVPVQPKNVLDLEEGEKDPEDILLSTVKRGKRTSPPTSRNRPQWQNDSPQRGLLPALEGDQEMPLLKMCLPRVSPPSEPNEIHYPLIDPLRDQEVERLTDLLAQRDAEIANLKAAQTEGPGPMQALRQENEELKAKVNELTQKLLHAH
ncbi:hypothetical protein HAX54_001714 [Datura stramonium]|uniref:Uncharacterized protein n=1 Tax=Datura stramonium TaxID=4076 RepID=A0ABS8T2T1_DATST|nr:hypothetical protein [Datura stramonium]